MKVDFNEMHAGLRRRGLLLTLVLLAVAQFLALGAYVLQPPPPAAPAVVTQADKPATAAVAEDEPAFLPPVYPGG